MSEPSEAIARLEERVSSMRTDVAELKEDVRAQSALYVKTSARVADLAQSVAVLTPEYRSMVNTTTRVEETVSKLTDIVSDLTHWRSRVIGIAIGASALTSGSVSAIIGSLSN
jgi:uncharacterized protein YoxC